MTNSPIEGRSMRGLRIHDRYGINLLAVARQEMAPRARLGSIRFQTGDVLLLQGESNTLQQALSAMSCLPLAGLLPTSDLRPRQLGSALAANDTHRDRSRSRP